MSRNVAIDAYRGFVMLLMMAEVLQLARVAGAFPGNWFWAILAYNQTHVEWAGCSLHDLMAVNPDVDWKHLKVGQKLKLPEKKS